MLKIREITTTVAPRPRILTIEMDVAEVLVHEAVNDARFLGRGRDDGAARIDQVDGK